MKEKNNVHNFEGTHTKLIYVSEFPTKEKVWSVIFTM